MAKGKARSILFRIFYSTSFTIVFLLTIAFCCAGPIDSIYQSYRRNRLIDIFLLAGVYVLTGLLAIFLYASRLYTNRSTLRDIPKTYMPLDKAELANRRVWRLIEDCKSRSAVIAYLARPRARRVESLEGMGWVRERINTLLKPEHKKHATIFEPKWGSISHPGWSSPASKDTPNLDYGTVVAELTDLIEARAVSLAPVDPVLGLDEHDLSMADEYVIEALRRPEECGMRQYISQLISLDVLDNTSLVIAFLTLYERARFASEPLAEDDFKTLMRMFAEMLRTMKTLNVQKLDLPDDFDDDITTTRDPSLAPVDDRGDKQTEIARNIGSIPSTSSLASSISGAGSVRHYNNTSTTAQHRSRLPLSASAPPRISQDSLRSVSSTEPYEDANRNTSWVEPTDRPPFLRARSSQSNATDRSRGSRARQRASKNTNSSRRQSRLKRALTRDSIDTTRSSLHSMKSQGSVIRLNPAYDGSREQLPFEYIKRMGSNENDTGAMRRNNVV